MTMRTVAKTLGLHESTITRAVANKFLICPGGTLPLRDFFTHAYHSSDAEPFSATTVRAHLIDLIDHEDVAHPYTDDQLSAKLSEHGITCSRRTVAKHRNALGLPNRNARRR